MQTVRTILDYRLDWLAFAGLVVATFALGSFVIRRARLTRDSWWPLVTLGLMLIFGAAAAEWAGREGPRSWGQSVSPEMLPEVEALVLRLAILGLTHLAMVIVGASIYLRRLSVTLARSERMHAEIAAAENQFRSICEDIPNVAVQGYNEDREVIFWNRASAELYGYTAQEALGRRLEELIVPPSMRGAVVAGIRRWAEGGAPLPAAEVTRLHQGGRSIRVYSSQAMQIDSQERRALYCVDIDLSERNRAQEALAESEANYRTLFEAMPLPMWVCDAGSFRIFAVNGAALRNYGYTRDEFIGLSLRQLQRSDDVSDLLASGPCQKWHYRKDGEAIFMEVVSHAVVWGGRHARIVLAHDITTRKAAEQRTIEQAELLDKITDAIVVVDANDRIGYWNRGAERLFGRSADEMRKVSVRVMAGMCRAGVLAEALTAHPRDWYGELSMPGADGRPVYLETSIAMVHDNAGRETARLCVCSDITERKLLERQVVQAQKMEVLGQLAGGVAHDFNSILMAMTLNLEMLQADLKSQPAAGAMLEDVKSMTQRASTLVGKLLLFARRHAMHPQPLELNAALAGVMKILRRLLRADITLELKGGGSALWVQADACMLDQVVLNLCVNARDAMPQGGTLALETSQIDLGPAEAAAQPGTRAGSFACLRVSDTGHGMSPEVLAHMFEPFFTTKEPGQGTGLGLSTVHGIVHQHGGWIGVESDVGRGTTFNIFLPLCEKPAVPPTEEEETESVGSGRETILLLEDDEAVRRICAAMLLRLGYRVFLSGSGQEAMRVWEQNPGAIDLLLSDVVLPGRESGIDVAKRLRERQPSLRIVLMSGYNTETLKLGELAAQGVTFVQKPIKSAAIAAVIRSALE